MLKSTNSPTTLPAKNSSRRSLIETDDGTTLFYQDWGTGQPVVFIHGWGYEGAAHGLFVTHKDRLNRDLLTFIQS